MINIISEENNETHLKKMNYINCTLKKLRFIRKGVDISLVILPDLMNVVLNPTLNFKRTCRFSKLFAGYFRKFYLNMIIDELANGMILTSTSKLDSNQKFIRLFLSSIKLSSVTIKYIPLFKIPKFNHISICNIIISIYYSSKLITKVGLINTLYLSSKYCLYLNTIDGFSKYLNQYKHVDKFHAYWANKCGGGLETLITQSLNSRGVSTFSFMFTSKNDHFENNVSTSFNIRRIATAKNILTNSTSLKEQLINDFQYQGEVIYIKNITDLNPVLNYIKSTP